MNTIWLDLLGARVGYYGKKYRTRVIEAGEGEVLLLLHGIGGHAEAYSRNIMRLAKHFRVLAIDFVWHGLSSKPEFKGVTIPTYMDQIIDLMEDLGVDRVSIEGESLGGWVALYMAFERPELLNRIILNTSAGVVFKPETIETGLVEVRDEEGIKLLRERSLNAIDNPTYETCRKRLEWLMASPERVTDELVALRHAFYNDPETKRALRSVFEYTFDPKTSQPYRIHEQRLGELNLPTLVLWSDKNPGSGADVGRHIANQIPGSTYHCINDAAHWPQWEHAEEHDRVVAEFMQGGSLARENKR
ncbi:MAG: alpha/beta hydrolase [Aquisalimonadaceae bacterium]